MLIDTHSHIYDEAFDEDRAEVVARAKSEGVMSDCSTCVAHAATMWCHLWDCIRLR